MDSLTVVPRTVQSETVDKLRNAIVTGHFKPGTRLAESMLCQVMNVSRTSIREALRRLEGEKLIVIIPNKGPSVAEIRWEEAAAIYEVRALLEGEAAARCAAHIASDQLKSLRLAVRHFAAAVTSDDALGRIKSTNDFYDIILAACDNPVIGEVLHGLKARINYLRFQSMAQPGRGKFSAAELKKIMQAIESRNASAARKAAVEHVNSASLAAKEFFERSNRSPAGDMKRAKRASRAA